LLNKGQGIGAEPLHPGEKAPGGLTSTPPARTGPITEEDKYAKLIEQLDVARTKAELLADAEGKAPAAIRDANIEIQTQTELLKLYNERTHQGVSEWSAQGVEIRQRIKEISDLTLAKQASGEIRGLEDEVANQQELTAAQTQGAQAVRDMKDAIEAHNIAARLDIAADSDWAKQVGELVRQKNEEARSFDADKAITDLQRQVSEQEQLVTAYQQGAEAVKQVQEYWAGINELERMGLSATSELGQQYLALRDRRAEVTKNADDAKKAFEQHQEIIKTLSDDIIKFGSSMMTAFEQGKNSSKSFTDELRTDFMNLIHDIENELLKLMVYQPLEQALTSALGGGAGIGTASGGSGFRGAVTGGLDTLFGSTLPRFAEGGMVDGPAMPELGLGHDAVPIIAHRGEQVIPAAQAGKGAGGPSFNIRQEFNIQTPDAGSFRAAQSHVMADAHRSALAAARKT